MSRTFHRLLRWTTGLDSEWEDYAAEKGRELYLRNLSEVVTSTLFSSKPGSQHDRTKKLTGLTSSSLHRSGRFPRLVDRPTLRSQSSHLPLLCIRQPRRPLHLPPNRHRFAHHLRDGAFLELDCEGCVLDVL